MRFVSPARHHHPRRAPIPATPLAVRIAWREFLAVARGRASAAAAGRPHERAEEVLLAQHVLQTARAPFPVLDAPARGMAEAFARLAKTFLETTGPERRAQMAAPLERLAEALDEILEAKGLADAARGRAMLGEHDE